MTLCQLCEKNHGTIYEYEYRIRHRRTLICFCDACVNLVLRKKLAAPAYIPDCQVIAYIKFKDNMYYGGNW